MNKLLKGSIASAAGVALLLGGAGTFALWNSTASVAGGTISAGNLSVTDPTPGVACVWAANGTTIAALASFKTAPGDILTCTKTIDVTATGNDMSVTLGLTSAGPVASTSSTADTALAGYLAANTVLTATGAAVTATGTPPVYSITPGANGVTNSAVTVVATITFPRSATAGALGSVNLSALTVTLTQN